MPNFWNSIEIGGISIQLQGVPASFGLILSKKVEFWTLSELSAPLEIMDFIE